MLRISVLLQRFNFSDPAVLRPCTIQAPCGRSSALIWEANQSRTKPRCAGFGICWKRLDSGPLFETVNRHLQTLGIKVTTGTIEDATIVHAPNSTKNTNKARDPEMHQTAKGKRWYFGMKAHVWVDSQAKLIHSVTATAAHVTDITVPPRLLHGRETGVWGDRAYQGQTAVMRLVAPQVQDWTNRRVRYQGVVDPVEWAKNRTKAGSPPGRNMFLGSSNGSLALRRSGIGDSPRNTHRLLHTCALTNLYLFRCELQLTGDQRG